MFFIVPTDAHNYKIVEMLKHQPVVHTVNRTPAQQADMPP
jgi:hypothetical protein